MTLTPGERLGPYEIVGALGKGGMGEVYRARDARLNRDVAVKILPAQLAGDAERIARFAREAQLLASLNHQNIGAIYGLEETGGVRALILELIEGATLAERLTAGPIPVAETVNIACQITDALDAAHERGIVHRDLKPANVKITPDGVVKVLDFGLAKASAFDNADSELTHSPTLTEPTLHGVLLGTAPYMSPEQARGKVVDKRSDIWAFGCVLYELLSGRRAFRGETTTETLAAVIEREPDWAALPPSTPLVLVRLLRRCLEKDPKRRLRDIGDARYELADAHSAPSRANEGPRRRSGPAVGAIVFAAAALVVAGVSWWIGRNSVRDDAPAFDHMVRLVSTPAHEFGPAISPDGKWVAYLSNARGPTDIWVKFIAGGEPANLTASLPIEVQSQDYISGLEVSPDGTLIAFGAGLPGMASSRNATWVIPAPLGGVARKMLKDTQQGLRWSPDGKQMAYMFAGGSSGDGLLIADADGQNERQIVKPEGGRHIHWLRWAPDGRSIYFDFGIQNFNTEPTEIFRASTTGGAPEPVVRTARRAAFPFPSPDGHGLFYAANSDSVDLSLWWRDFRSGRDSRVTSGIGEYAEPVVSPDGRRLVATLLDVRQTLERVPVAFDRSVALEPITDGFSGDFDPSFSPDGTHTVFSSSRTGNRNLWSAGADFSRPSPLTSGTFIDERPVYSPDGRQVAFVSDRGGHRGVWVVSAEGGTPRFVSPAEVLDAVSWSPDGRRLVYAVPGGDAPRLMLMDVANGHSASLGTPGGASAPAWSPRGDVIAYLEPRAGVGTQVRFVSPDGQLQYTHLPDVTKQLGNGLLAWSPDGRRLAAVGLPGPVAGYIWIVEPDSPAPFRKLLDLPAGVFLRGATWTHDGSAIVIGHIRWTGDIVLAERSR